MKKTIFLSMLFFTLSAAAQNCNIGNQSATGFTNSGDPIFKDFLVGIQFTLGTTGTLKSLNLIGRNSGGQVKMALYKDVSGVPGSLVDSTGSKTVTSGIVSFAVTPTVLDSGSYWIMAIYSSNGSHTYSKTQTGGNVYYNAQPFSSSIPTNASDFILYKNNTTFTYFIGMDCGITVGTHPESASLVNIYPNPATDRINLNTLPDIIGATYSITNATGKELLSGQVRSETNVIDINTLQSGLYFLLISSQQRETVKFFKQ